MDISKVKSQLKKKNKMEKNMNFDGSQWENDGVDTQVFTGFDGSQWENDGVDTQVFTGFDGSQWANDGIEKQIFTGFEGNNDTNQTTQLTEDEVVRVTEIYGTALNQTGGGMSPSTQLTEDEVVRVSEIYGTALNYDGMSPNMELELPENDNSQMPDSDLWFNHPGLFGITWSSKKREEKKYLKELAKVNSNFPNTGSCAVLTDSFERLESELQNLNANKDGGGKGAKRVNARGRKARNARIKSVKSGMEASCAGEEATFQKNTQVTQQILQGGSNPSTGLSPLNLGIGIVLLGGIVYGITRMNKK